jgi:hypothetical protein
LGWYNLPIKFKGDYIMTYDEYINIIMDSDIEDWEYDDTHQSYLYKKDISIMLNGREEEHDRNFYENWVTKYHDEKAYVHVVELRYNGARIQDFYTALVDGCRMCIPYPSVNGLEISSIKYKIGRIINIPYCGECDRYDEYLSMAGIKVK